MERGIVTILRAEHDRSLPRAGLCDTVMSNKS
jgi:hypothetical protein